ncbi:MAG: hypothetical protein JHC87_03110 [Thermoleophilaceae bacterium]|nr:hypothetical protein [Thermoleophilaceae bacterium]
MSWLLIAVDDDTLAAVLDDARVRSLEGNPEFVLVTPRDQRWGNERDQNDDTYLHDLDAGVRRLQDEGVRITHEWLTGGDLVQEVVEVGRRRGATGAVIAHHNPDYAIPDPGDFDDAIRRELDIALDVISLE